MITFDITDPLFVIDFSDHFNPKINGHYWMYGYSNYLHPVTKDVIIGFGKQADAQGRDQYLKIALFNVSSTPNPTLIDDYHFNSEPKMESLAR